MNRVEVLQQKSELESLKERIRSYSMATVQIMEVCGTHTTAIARSGLRQVIPRTIRLLSGPGCPVCVTSNGDIDRVLEIAKLDRVTILTFGDMLHVPGTMESLETIRTEKNNVRVVYSPEDALQYAIQNPDENCVFVGVGFETTIPSIAANVISAKRKGIRNYFIAPLFKLVPPALNAILQIKERKIDGFILPGHVSTIIGIRPYQFITDQFQVPGVISGFEPMDILRSIALLLQMIEEKDFQIKNEYTRSVTLEGNFVAKMLIDRVFQISDAFWRAIGNLPHSGLEFRLEYSEFDAFKKFSIPPISSKEPKGCRCGEILLGLCGPMDCPLFARRCTPSSPVGPCMVSSEGACSAAYHYGEDSL